MVAEDESDAATALKGARGRRRPAAEEDEEEEEVPVGAAPAAPWGPIPAIFLFFALIITSFGGLMGYELIHTMWGYQQPRKPSAPVVRSVANTLEMDVKDQ